MPAKPDIGYRAINALIGPDVDVPRLTMRVKLNGAPIAEFATDDMAFGVARYIHKIARYITPYPGDVIWMGADSPTKDMMGGDVVEAEIDGIGVLRNPVVNEG